MNNALSSLSTVIPADLLGQSGLHGVDKLSEDQNQNAVSDFDSIFYSMMLKTMRNSMTENGLFGKESSDTFGGMFDLFMSQHMAKSQPLGVGQILHQYVQSNQGSE